MTIKQTQSIVYQAVPINTVRAPFARQFGENGLSGLLTSTHLMAGQRICSRAYGWAAQRHDMVLSDRLLVRQLVTSQCVEIV